MFREVSLLQNRRGVLQEVSHIADAVKKASEEKEERNFSSQAVYRKPAPSFLAASVISIVLLAGLAILFFYEESKIASLRSDFEVAQGSLKELKERNASLLTEKTSLEAAFNEENQKSRQKIDELLGKDKVLQYQNETVEADNTQKEKKIAELQAQIQQQDEKEEKLMALIEEAKKQMNKPVIVPVAPAPATTESPATAVTPATNT